MEIPAEIWLEIFSHLHNDKPRFLEPLSLVSKQFLALTNSIPTTLSLPDPSTRFLPSLFLRFKTLNSIDLSSFQGDPIPILLQIPRYYPNLFSLNLSNHQGIPRDALRETGYMIKGLKILTLSRLGFLDDNDLIIVADCFPNLEELDIGHPKTNSVTDAGICALSLKLSNLNSINISGCRFVTDTGVIALSLNCVFLKSIAMNDCFLVTANAIRSLLKNRPDLEELSAREIDDGTNGVHPQDLLTFEFARCLRSVDLARQFVPNECLLSIGKGWFPLRSLNLSLSLGFSIEGLESVLRRHPGIEHLKLQAVEFLTDNVISMLSGLLSGLVYVDLSVCVLLTPMAFYYLTRACPLLKKVKMRCINMLEVEEDSSLNSAISSQVRSLYLDTNDGLSDRCLELFVKLCPNLRFLDVSLCPKLSEEAALLVMKRCSEIAHLEINYCNISNLNIDFDVPSLEVLRVRGAKLNGKAVATIGKRCRNLRHLDLRRCKNVSADGVKEVVVNCKGLREINVAYCELLDVDIVPWMVLTRPSLRKIVPPYRFKFSETQRNLFLRRGCLVFEDW